MSNRDHLDFQDQGHHHDHGGDHLTNWAHQASNDATDFYRHQGRAQGIGSQTEMEGGRTAHKLDILEFTPLFGHHDHHDRHHHDRHHHHHDHGHNRAEQFLDTMLDYFSHADRPPVYARPMDRPEAPEVTLRRPPVDNAPPQVENQAPCPPGYDSVKWNNGHDTPKYFVGHLMANFLQEDNKNPDREGQPKRVEQFLKDHAGLLEAKGITVQKVEDEKMVVDIHDGAGAYWIDTVIDVGGNNPSSSWQVGAKAA